MVEVPAEPRIEALEIRLAHQEQAIEDLSTALTKQWEQIDALAREVVRLGERLRDAEARGVAGTALEPPPPHY